MISFVMLTWLVDVWYCVVFLAEGPLGVRGDVIVETFL